MGEQVKHLIGLVLALYTFQKSFSLEEGVNKKPKEDVAKFTALLSHKRQISPPVLNDPLWRDNRINQFPAVFIHKISKFIVSLPTFLLAHPDQALNSEITTACLIFIKLQWEIKTHLKHQNLPMIRRSYNFIFKGNTNICGTLSLADWSFTV